MCYKNTQAPPAQGPYATPGAANILVNVQLARKTGYFCFAGWNCLL